MSGRVVHFEIPFDDAGRAKAFYGDVFGWQFNEMEGFDYTGVSTGPAGEDGMPASPGYIGGGMTSRTAPVDRPVLTIEVDDMAAALAKVAEHGGAAIGEPMTVGDFGVAGYFTDSEGNVMGLWQSLGT